MLQTAARLLLLFAGGNGRYCGLAIVAEIGESISDASHFLDAPTCYAVYQISPLVRTIIPWGPPFLRLTRGTRPIRYRSCDGR
jgi:hypothetical protein